MIFLILKPYFKEKRMIEFIFRLWNIRFIHQCLYLKYTNMYVSLQNMFVFETHQLTSQVSVHDGLENWGEWSNSNARGDEYCVLGSKDVAGGGAKRPVDEDLERWFDFRHLLVQLGVSLHHDNFAQIVVVGSQTLLLFQMYLTITGVNARLLAQSRLLPRLDPLHTDFLLEEAVQSVRPLADTTHVQAVGSML